MKRYFFTLVLAALLGLTACTAAEPTNEPSTWRPKATAPTGGTFPTQPEPSTTEPTEPVPTEPEPALPAPTGVWDEGDYQVGEPVTPQPGDTQYSWQPELSADYPADEDCSSREFLEKWLAVEGVSLADLDERDCRQLIVTAAQEPDGVETCTTCYQKQDDGTWQAVEGLSWMSGWVGGNGIMHGRRRNTETSPAGLWSLGLAFGNEARPDGLQMPWRDVTPDSDWVCDEDSIYFNTWQERGDPLVQAVWSDDVEHLEDYPESYAYACVIRFNTAPYTIPDRGCAIFLHCSKRATGGCVGLPEADLVSTLLWLKPEQKPHILITGFQKT